MSGCPDGPLRLVRSLRRCLPLDGSAKDTRNGPRGHGDTKRAPGTAVGRRADRSEGQFRPSGCSRCSSSASATRSPQYLVAMRETTEPCDDVPVVDAVAGETLHEHPPRRWDRSGECVDRGDVAFLFGKHFAVVERVQQEHVPRGRQRRCEAGGYRAFGDGERQRIVREGPRRAAMAVAGELVEKHYDGKRTGRRFFPVPQCTAGRQVEYPPEAFPDPCRRGLFRRRTRRRIWPGRPPGRPRPRRTRSAGHQRTRASSTRVVRSRVIGAGSGGALSRARLPAGGVRLRGRADAWCRRCTARTISATESATARHSSARSKSPVSA